MKKIFSIISYFFVFINLFYFCFIINCSAQNESTLDKIKANGYITMGTSADFPPFESLKDGKIVGIDVEIAEKIAEKLGVKLKISDVSFSSLIFELKSGSVDFIASGWSYTDERAQNVDFSENYFTASQEIVIKIDGPIKKPEDLTGKKVGVQLGNTGDTYCTELGNMEVVRFDKYTDAIAALLNGNIDAMVMDDFAAKQVVRKNSDHICKLSENLTEESYGIAIKKGDTELLEIINATLAEIKQNGELEKIINSHRQTGEESGSFAEKYLPYIKEGLINTLNITFFAALIGMSVGFLLASLKITAKSNKKLKILGIFTDIYITITRGTPVLVQLFIMYYIILSNIFKDPIIVAIITFGINSGAYVCEHVRAGIEAIDKGQFEAGRSLGLHENTVMTRIIFPQAIKNILPSLAGETISLLKETAVVGFIGVMDLSLAGKKITSVTFEPTLPLFMTAVIYLALTAGLTFVLYHIERRFKKSDNH
jgi:His/Glu/Gln/Arg/opine family amino acid ABC transporter permease subunit